MGSTRRTKPLVTDELWAVIAPLLPRRPAQPKGGRPWVDDRAALNGVLYVLRSGVPWRMLPTELGYGSGVTCWRRLREWQRRSVWRRLHQLMLERLAAADRIDWTRAALDSRSVAAKKGEPRSARTRRIKENRARNTTSSSTGKASHSRSR
jgi:transposase